MNGRSFVNVGIEQEPCMSRGCSLVGIVLHNLWGVNTQIVCASLRDGCRYLHLQIAMVHLERDSRDT